MSAAFDIATQLATALLGTVGTDIGVNAFLDKGHNEIAVFEYPGEPDTAAHGSVVAFENLRIQLQVRNSLASSAWSTCYAAYVALRGQMDLTINAHSYTLIQGIAAPRILKRDDANRPIFYCELSLQRRPE